MGETRRPVTNQDFYLLAILDEIRQTNFLLASLLTPAEAAADSDELAEPDESAAAGPSTSSGQVVVLKEPERPATPIPDGFPGKAELEAAGITVLETVPADGDALVALPGIGKVTAGRILVALKG